MLNCQLRRYRVDLRDTVMCWLFSHYNIPAINGDITENMRGSPCAGLISDHHRQTVVQYQPRTQGTLILFQLYYTLGGTSHISWDIITIINQRTGRFSCFLSIIIQTNTLENVYVSYDIISMVNHHAGNVYVSCDIISRINQHWERLWYYLYNKPSPENVYDSCDITCIIHHHRWTSTFSVINYLYNKPSLVNVHVFCDIICIMNHHRRT